VSPEITMADAITALVAEKRTIGYKYGTEERVLSRFLAFCCARFPGLDAPSEASVEAWGRCCPKARGQAGDLADVGGTLAGFGPLARAPRRARLRPAPRRAAQTRSLRPAHLHRRGAGGPVRPDRPLQLLLGGPVPAPRHAGAVPHDLRGRLACLRSPPAARRRRRYRHRGPAGQSATRRAARTARCPRASRFVPGSPTTTPRSLDAPAGSGSSPAQPVLRSPSGTSTRTSVDSSGGPASRMGAEATARVCMISGIRCNTVQLR
jgi:hypothetical protein